MLTEREKRIEKKNYNAGRGRRDGRKEEVEEDEEEEVKEEEKEEEEEVEEEEEEEETKRKKLSNYRSSAWEFSGWIGRPFPKFYQVFFFRLAPSPGNN